MSLFASLIGYYDAVGICLIFKDMYVRFNSKVNIEDIIINNSIV